MGKRRKTRADREAKRLAERPAVQNVLQAVAEELPETSWTQFDKVNFDGWREHILQICAPIIPFETQIPEHDYVCFEAGPVDGVVNMYFVPGERYKVQKSRFSDQMVEIKGLFFKKDPDRTRRFKHYFPVSIENCKKHLKAI